ncbi:hypothetical protein IOD16_23975 [Saccharothrix sp. 6-C]|uniref:hypothetical protein n=1 Tax=Saccharothrix sp. 6-C TaxID=2781735 RepID=UPI001916D566|nr:hypothetical protein [Saccharothrix sp. 6-C]QQQ74248.1 hypothetical protein IOD16_23975 [Saccharothrix sp. 6-C]
MLREKRTGSVATVLCDSGDRHPNTYYDPDWHDRNHVDTAPREETITRFLGTGFWLDPGILPTAAIADRPTIWDNV